MFWITYSVVVRQIMIAIQIKGLADTQRMVLARMILIQCCAC
jgi:hypothetical protein